MFVSLHLISHLALPTHLGEIFKACEGQLFLAPWAFGLALCSLFLATQFLGGPVVSAVTTRDRQSAEPSRRLEV